MNNNLDSKEEILNVSTAIEGKVLSEIFAKTLVGQSIEDIIPNTLRLVDLNRNTLLKHDVILSAKHPQYSGEQEDHIHVKTIATISDLPEASRELMEYSFYITDIQSFYHVSVVYGDTLDDAVYTWAQGCRIYPATCRAYFEAIISKDNILKDIDKSNQLYLWLLSKEDPKRVILEYAIPIDSEYSIFNTYTNTVIIWEVELLYDKQSIQEECT